MVAKLSVTIITFNEEKNLSRAIASVKSIADEIVVCDTESNDDTVKIAKSLGARIFTHKNMGYVEPVRNFSISKTVGDWVLILDADEEIPNTLAKKIKDIIKKPQADYYRIPRKNIVFGKWLKYSRWWPDYNIRLFRKGTVSWNEVIHTVPMTQGVGGEIDGKEEFAMIHYHYDSIEQYVERMNRYTSQQAKMKLAENYKFNWKDLLSKPVGEFLSRYFFGEGYKDGIHGLALAMLQGFSELVLYLKTWQSEKFMEKEINISEVIFEMAIKEKELHFWQNDALYKETGSLAARIKRKLRI
jgi:(heptosyl)LPS beta-1,4-glucosyltransferase